MNTDGQVSQRSLSNPRGDAHGKTYDIFVGSRYLGPRNVDYKTLQSETQLGGVSATRSKDVIFHQNLYDATRKKMNKTTINF